MSIAEAERDLANTEARIGALERQLTEARDRAAKIRGYLEMAELYNEGIKPPAPSTAGRRAKHKSLIADTIYRALRVRSGPVQVSELIVGKRVAGVVSGAADLEAYVTSILLRDPRFIYLGEEGWTVEDSGRAKEPVGQSTSTAGDADHSGQTGRNGYNRSEPSVVGPRGAPKGPTLHLTGE